jgi:hypothetical protein
MHLAPMPAISVEALLELKRLLAPMALDSHNVTIEPRHCSVESGDTLRRVDPPVVEGDHAASRSNAVDDPGIPPIQFRG